MLEIAAPSAVPISCRAASARQAMRSVTDSRLSATASAGTKESPQCGLLRIPFWMYTFVSVRAKATAISLSASSKAVSAKRRLLSGSSTGGFTGGCVFSGACAAAASLALASKYRRTPSVKIPWVRLSDRGKSSSVCFPLRTAKPEYSPSADRNSAASLGMRACAFMEASGTVALSRMTSCTAGQISLLRPSAFSRFHFCSRNAFSSAAATMTDARLNAFPISPKKFLVSVKVRKGCTSAPSMEAKTPSIILCRATVCEDISSLSIANNSTFTGNPPISACTMCAVRVCGCADQALGIHFDAVAYGLERPFFL